MNWNYISAYKKELFGRSVTYNGFIPKYCAILCSAATKLSIKSSSLLIEFKNCLNVIFLYLALKWTANQLILELSLYSTKPKLQGLYLSSTVI